MTAKREILLKLEEMKGRLSSGLSSSDKSFIEKIQETVLRRPFVKTSCNDCYKDAVIEMYLFLQKNEIMQKTNYTLKAGVILQTAGDPNIYTNSNLTDKAAERYLKDNPNRINFFASHPADWEERAGLKEIQKEVTESEKEFISLLSEKLKDGATKAALKEEYKEYEIDGKKVTARAMLDYLKEADKSNEEKTE
jgi:hypothetical protein